MLFSEEAFAPLCRGADAGEQPEDLERAAHREFMNLFKVPGGST